MQLNLHWTTYIIYIGKEIDVLMAPLAEKELYAGLF